MVVSDVGKSTAILPFEVIANPVLWNTMLTVSMHAARFTVFLYVRFNMDNLMDRASSQSK